MSGWTVLGEKRLLDHWPWVRVTRQRVQLEDESTVIDDWYTVDMAPFALILALTPDRQVALVEQYRHALGRRVLEVPAGHIPDKEDPLAAAQRELLEETGLSAPHWEALGAWIGDPNRGCGVAHGFLALDARPTAAPLPVDLQEQTLHLKPLTEVEAMLQAGAFPTIATVATLGAGLLRLAEHDQG